MHDPAFEAFIQRVAREGGTIALKTFGTEGAHRYKSAHAGDVVTKADVRVEKYIVRQIRKAYPEHGIIGEEGKALNADAEYVWLIDPIDGTLNFATGIPVWGTMIALVHRGEVIFASIYLPVVDELLFAKKGGGAYLNGKRISGSRTADWRGSRGCMPARGPRSLDFLTKLFKLVKGKNVALAAYGCAAVHCRLLATGGRDWLAMFTGMAHDYAPTSLIMSEAGCAVTDIDGRPWNVKGQGLVAASTPELHRKLMRVIHAT